jgi:hypothetical protein
MTAPEDVDTCPHCSQPLTEEMLGIDPEWATCPCPHCKEWLYPDPEQLTDRSVYCIGRVAGLAMLLLAWGFSLSTVKDLWQARQFEQWTAVPASIERAVMWKRKGDEADSLQTEIALRYEVDGQSYLCTRIALAPPDAAREEVVEKLAGLQASEQPTSCWVSPRDPTQSVHLRSLWIAEFAESLFGCVFCSLFAAGGLGFAAYFGRKRRSLLSAAQAHPEAPWEWTRQTPPWQHWLPLPVPLVALSYLPFLMLLGLPFVDTLSLLDVSMFLVPLAILALVVFAGLHLHQENGRLEIESAESIGGELRGHWSYKRPLAATELTAYLCCAVRGVYQDGPLTDLKDEKSPFDAHGTVIAKQTIPLRIDPRGSSAEFAIPVPAPNPVSVPGENNSVSWSVFLTCKGYSHSFPVALFYPRDQLPTVTTSAASDVESDEERKDAIPRVYWWIGKLAFVFLWGMLLFLAWDLNADRKAEAAYPRVKARVTDTVLKRLSDTGWELTGTAHYEVGGGSYSREMIVADGLESAIAVDEARYRLRAGKTITLCYPPGSPDKALRPGQSTLLLVMAVLALVALPVVGLSVWWVSRRHREDKSYKKADSDDAEAPEPHPHAFLWFVAKWVLGFSLIYALFLVVLCALQFTAYWLWASLIIVVLGLVVLAHAMLCLGMVVGAFCLDSKLHTVLVLAMVALSLLPLIGVFKLQDRYLPISARKAVPEGDRIIAAIDAAETLPESLSELGIRGGEFRYFRTDQTLHHDIYGDSE